MNHNSTTPPVPPIEFAPQSETPRAASTAESAPHNATPPASAPQEAELRELVLAVYHRDPAALAAQIEVAEVRADSVTLTRRVTPDMLNGHRVLHGGHLFLLADTAFAYRMALTGADYLSRSAEIIFIAPVPPGALISATAQLRTQFGRNAICDVQVTDDSGAVVGEVRVNGVAARNSA